MTYHVSTDVLPRLYPRPVLTSPDLDALIADTETEILRVIEQVQDERTGTG